MSGFSTMGEYQLRNLILNRVNFLYIDLSEKGGTHDLLIGSRRGTVDRVLEIVHEEKIAPEGPIVLICENGTKSVAAAEILAGNSYLNVFVVEGGTESFGD